VRAEVPARRMVRHHHIRSAYSTVNTAGEKSSEVTHTLPPIYAVRFT
jgi:hypothetical protein